MSHATVLVVGEDVEGQLSAYDEQLEIEEHKTYIEITPVSWIGKTILKESPDFDLSDLKAVRAYCSEKWGETYHLDEDGLYELSTSNPQGKWDWWVVGGRWNGLFIVKHEYKEKVLGPNKEGWYSQEQPSRPYESRRTDAARKHQIDWGAMRRIRMVSTRRAWQAYQEEIKKPDANLKWAAYSHGIDPDDTYESLMAEAVGQQYALSTHAVLKDGEWKEVGMMGWFGLSDDTTEDRAAWGKWYQEFLAELPEDSFLTIVDYHV